MPGRLAVALVARRLDLQGDEARRFALACGTTAVGIAEHERSDRHLRDVAKRYGLTVPFREAGPGRHHQAMRPTGYDHDAEAVIPEAVEAWRAAYRALLGAHQMVAATIAWLCRGGQDTIWLSPGVMAWPAADAIAVLRDAGALADRGLLVALYPGW